LQSTAEDGLTSRRNDRDDHDAGKVLTSRPSWSFPVPSVPWPHL